MSKKKTFVIEEKALNVRLDLKKVSPAVKEALEEFKTHPEKENLIKAVTLVQEEQNLSHQERQELLDHLESQMLHLFAHDESPSDYATLKKEALFLSRLTQYSFIFMAQRLQRIRDGRLYVQDGYKDFRSFILAELDISKSTVYNYLSLLDIFGVHPGGHQDIEYTKLVPILPLLKDTQHDERRLEQFKQEAIERSMNHSKREMIQWAAECRELVGLGRRQNSITRKSVAQLFEAASKGLPKSPEIVQLVYTLAHHRYLSQHEAEKIVSKLGMTSHEKTE